MENKQKTAKIKGSYESPPCLILPNKHNKYPVNPKFPWKKGYHLFFCQKDQANGNIFSAVDGHTAVFHNLEKFKPMKGHWGTHIFDEYFAWFPAVNVLVPAIPNLKMYTNSIVENEEEENDEDEVVEVPGPPPVIIDLVDNDDQDTNEEHNNADTNNEN